MIEKIQTDFPKILAFKLSGKLHDEDYKVFVPAVEDCLASEHEACLFAQLEDFQGWDLHAAWDDLKFGVKHYADFKRIALVGDRQWEKWMAMLCKPFTKAEVKYFDASQAESAWLWLREAI